MLALCVLLHAIGMTLAIRWVKRHPVAGEANFFRVLWMLIGVATWAVCLHLIEISIWAVYFAWREGMPDFPSALYFSAVTYTTTGYGDLLLPQAWRLVGAVESLTGILMCGWSTAFFFAVVNRMNVTSMSGTGSGADVHHAP
jgi:voltage-gated potassium channel Kch